MSVCIKLHAAMPSAMFLSDVDFLSFLKDNWLYPSNPIFINKNDKKKWISSQLIISVTFNSEC